MGEPIRDGILTITSADGAVLSVPYVEAEIEFDPVPRDGSIRMVASFSVTGWPFSASCGPFFVHISRGIGRNPNHRTHRRAMGRRLLRLYGFRLPVATE